MNQASDPIEPRTESETAHEKDERPVLLIRPTRGITRLDLVTLWKYRETILFLAWRDLKVRYRQTALGASWAILQPLLNMLFFTVLFGQLANVSSGDVPYPLFSFVGLVPWTFFAASLSRAGNSLISNQHLISKVYFPRLTIPIASILPGVVDFVLSFLVGIVLLVAYGRGPTSAWLFLPVVVVLMFAVALGIGLWLSALSVAYRDVSHTIPFLTQLWLLATPAAYPTSLVPERLQSFFALNPMVGVVEAFRWCVLGTPAAFPTFAFATASGVALVVLASGAAYFRSVERTFSDVI